MRPYVELVRKDGTTERAPIIGHEVVVGRSTNAGISLPNEPELELEHLMLLPRGNDGCWVSVADGAAVPIVGNAQFESGIVKWGTEFRIGSLVLRVVREDTSSTKMKLPEVNPVLLAALVVGVGFLAWTFLRDDGIEAAIDAGRSREHVELFDEPPPCRAAQMLPGGAKGLEGVAHARGDRYAYDPRDGVRAVNLYREAASCYERDGQGEDADRMKRFARDLQERVDSDYAAARLSLSHAIDTKNWRDASNVSKRLLLLTAHAGEHTYTTWLDNVHRQVSVKATHD